MLKQMNLEKFENVNAGTYSGGNKRKLSVAIALLGNPPIILLDEPSSGMDPDARRFMWSVISRVSIEKKQSSVILTTHSMEEAEALSTKLAIMVEGVIKCIGPVQTLKDKYGKGFEIEIKIKIPEAETLMEIASYQKKEQLDDFIEQKNAQAFVYSIGGEKFWEEIDLTGHGSHIYKQLQNKKGCHSRVIVEYIYIKQQSTMIEKFLNDNFGNIKILEAFQSFFRFKTENNVKLSVMFGLLEENKDKLEIGQYSIKQTTIEQIFIGFANQIEHDD